MVLTVLSDFVTPYLFKSEFASVSAHVGVQVAALRDAVWTELAKKWRDETLETVEFFLRPKLHAKG